PFAEVAQGGGDLGADGVEREVERLGDLAVGEAVEAAQAEDEAAAVRQLGDGGFVGGEQVAVRQVGVGGGAGGRLGRRGGRGERRGALPLAVAHVVEGPVADGPVEVGPRR